MECLKKKKQELTELIGLDFEVHGDVAVAKVNVKKYLYLLSRPAIQIPRIPVKYKIFFTSLQTLHPG